MQQYNYIVYCSRGKEHTFYRRNLISIRNMGKRFSLFRNVEMDPGAHPRSYIEVTVRTAGGMKLTSELYLLSGLRICGAIPQFPHTSSWHRV